MVDVAGLCVHCDGPVMRRPHAGHRVPERNFFHSHVEDTTYDINAITEREYVDQEKWSIFVVYSWIDLILRARLDLNYAKNNHLYTNYEYFSQGQTYIIAKLEINFQELLYMPDVFTNSILFVKY